MKRTIAVAALGGDVAGVPPKGGPLPEHGQGYAGVAMTTSAAGGGLPQEEVESKHNDDPGPPDSLREHGTPPVDRATGTARSVKAQLVDPEFVCSALEIDDGACPQTNGLMIRCPWHHDKTPSCSITIGSSGTLRAHCFGCGVGGDVFDLIAKTRGLDVRRQFREVLAEASRIAGTAPTAPTGRKVVATHTPLEVENFDRLAQRLLALSPLRPFTRGYEYLQRRHLLESGVADEWACLPENARDLEPIVRELTGSGMYAWESSGLFSETRTLNFSRNLLMIPWRDPEGRIETLQRRVLEADVDRFKYVFPKGRAPQHPYGISELSAATPALPIAFVEGAVDVLAYRTLCACAGRERTVLGLPGVAGWRPAWSAYGRGRVVYLALDADRAGEEACVRIGADLRRAGAREVLRKRPVGAKDWAAVLVARST